MLLLLLLLLGAAVAWISRSIMHVFSLVTSFTVARR